jgi:DNA-binding IclR family transcriptional regulator
MKLVHRIVSVLEIIAENKRPPNLSSLSTQSQLPISTVSRILDSLMLHGLVEQDKLHRTYSIGPRFFYLASHYNTNQQIITAARPALEWLSQESKEDTGLSMLYGAYAIIVDRVYGPQPLKIISSITEVVPLYCGAFRKVLLAYQEPDFIRRYLEETNFVRFTRDTINSKNALKKELQSIRRKGYAVSFGEYLPDAAGVAAPVFGMQDRIEFAIFIVGPRIRLTKEEITRLAKLVVGTSEYITKHIRGELSSDDFDLTRKRIV